MKNMNHYVAIYKEQLDKRAILIAYNQLVKFVMEVRVNFIKNLSEQYTFTGILHRYMNYTYFYYSNDFLKTKTRIRIKSLGNAIRDLASGKYHQYSKKILGVTENLNGIKTKKRCLNIPF